MATSVFARARGTGHFFKPVQFIARRTTSTLLTRLVHVVHVRVTLVCELGYQDATTSTEVIENGTEAV